jgi:hypothetical protein
MKINKWMLAIISVVTITVAGCNKPNSVDATPLENGFKAAEPAAKSSADKAVAAIKAQDYAGALAELKTLASNAKLTPEQQQAIKDVMASVQNALTAAAGKITQDAGKAASDLQKSIPK